jgi:hypothetical protein
MMPVSTFAGGPESASRLTREGFERKAELLADIREAGWLAFAPSPD